ncbi:uncharacterized protein LOC115680419 [Syzygium oleosum]|uniref:uncharacterized protein LOC115680419 n=1 Tax=Syzygium oleosum TaxID=219896 RepID=UPI0011D18625|nr:uncharacterized protein LOC115680419 [Syzygium oleosum]XP_056161210.1 uncharacterized protein LOC115680419 [Syzygium oleosum]
MQQRRSLTGRPSGTDGSDFSYRMTVDSRYQKVAQGRSQLQTSISIQAVVQLIRAVCLALSISKGNVPSPLAMSSLATAFLSIIVGELGRRRSRVNFLRFYIVAAAAVILLSIACLVKGDLKLEDILNVHVKVRKFEFLEATSVLLGLLVQVFTVKTTVSLISNMSPPKRTS